MSRSAGIYNLTSHVRSILKRHRKEPPSLLMHLHTDGLRFGTSDTLYSYDGEMKPWIDCIREQRMPNELLDTLDEAGVRFFDGCLIVEVHDHRSADQEKADIPSPAPGSAISRSAGGYGLSAGSTIRRENSEEIARYRITLSPTNETLWRDLLLMNEQKAAQIVSGAVPSAGKKQAFKWKPFTEEEAVEIEAMILERTTPTLCLAPTMIASRIANAMLAETTLQGPSESSQSNKTRKRPLNSGEEEQQRRRRERKERFMNIGDEGYGLGFAPTFSRFDLVDRIRNHRKGGGEAVHSMGAAAPSAAHSSSQQQRKATAAAAPHMSIPVNPHEAPSPAPSATSSRKPSVAAAEAKKWASIAAAADSPAGIGSPSTSTLPATQAGSSAVGLKGGASGIAKGCVPLTAEQEKRKRAEQKKRAKEKKAQQQQPEATAACGQQLQQSHPQPQHHFQPQQQAQQQPQQPQQQFRQQPAQQQQYPGGSIPVPQNLQSVNNLGRTSPALGQLGNNNGGAGQLNLGGQQQQPQQVPLQMANWRALVHAGLLPGLGQQQHQQQPQQRIPHQHQQLQHLQQILQTQQQQQQQQGIMVPQNFGGGQGVQNLPVLTGFQGPHVIPNLQALQGIPNLQQGLGNLQGMGGMGWPGMGGQQGGQQQQGGMAYYGAQGGGNRFTS